MCLNSAHKSYQKRESTPVDIDRLFVKTEVKMKEIADIVRKLDLEIPVQVAREGKLY